MRREGATPSTVGRFVSRNEPKLERGVAVVSSLGPVVGGGFIGKIDDAKPLQTLDSVTGGDGNPTWTAVTGVKDCAVELRGQERL